MVVEINGLGQLWSYLAETKAVGMFMYEIVYAVLTYNFKSLSTCVIPLAITHVSPEGTVNLSFRFLVPLIVLLRRLILR